MTPAVGHPPPDERPVGAARSWTRLVGEAVHVDRTQLAVLPAGRCALGIAVPLVAGDLSGHVLVGVAAAIGALTSGMASLQGTYRSRVRVMAFAAAAFALSAFAGATVGHVQGLDVALTAAWGAAGGFLVLFGPAPAMVGLQAVLGLVVFSQFSFSAEHAALNALWALCGAAVQILLVPLSWRLQHFPAERAASSAAYRQLADHLRSPAGTTSILLDPRFLDELRSALTETQPWGDPTACAAYQALADEAERIRLTAAAISRTRSRVGGGATPTPGSDAPGWARNAANDLDAAIGASARVLGEVADALHDARGAVAGPDDGQLFRGAVDRLRTVGRTAGWQDRVTIAQAVEDLTALAGQLRSAVQLTAVAAGGRHPAPGATGAPGTPGPRRRLPAPVATGPGHLEMARANLTLGSEAFRHALRLGATLAIAVAISHLFPFGHGYWLPLTVMIVLKPDFATTLSRGAARSVGTLVGAGVVTLLLAALAPAPAGLIALTVALYAASIAVMRANYGLYSVGIASLVVCLLAFTGSPAPALAGDRAFYTVVGAALALTAYAIWPTWERGRVADRLADLVETDGRYGAALLHAWADPPAADRAARQRLRRAARLARANAEASVARWLAEPAGRRPMVAGTLDPESAQGILAAVRRYVWAALVLDAELPAGGPGRAELHLLAVEVERAGATVAAALRSGTPTTYHPHLRATQVSIAGPLLHPPTGTDGDAVSATVAADVVLARETDLMVDALNTIAHLADVERRASP